MVDGKVNVKLVPAEIADTVDMNGVVGTTQVGADGRFPAKDKGSTKMRLAAVTAVVLMV